MAAITSLVSEVAGATTPSKDADGITMSATSRGVVWSAADWGRERGRAAPADIGLELGPLTVVGRGDLVLATGDKSVAPRARRGCY